MTRVYILAEIGFGLLLILMVYVLTGTYGLVGVSMAYCLTYIAYWLTMILVFRSRLREMQKC